MNKFFVRATDGAVPSVKFEVLNYRKIKIYTDETEGCFIFFNDIACNNSMLN